MLLTVLHYLHVLVGVTWVGGSFVFFLLIFPMIAAMPAAEAKALYERMYRPMVGLMGGSAVLVLVLGLLRAWMGGGIPSWGDLLAPYGLTVIASVVIWVVIEAIGGSYRSRLRRRFDTPDVHAAEAVADARQIGTITNILLLVLVALMVVMGLGLV